MDYFEFEIISRIGSTYLVLNRDKKKTNIANSLSLTSSYTLYSLAVCNFSEERGWNWPGQGQSDCLFRKNYQEEGFPLRFQGLFPIFFWEPLASWQLCSSIAERCFASTIYYKISLISSILLQFHITYQRFLSWDRFSFGSTHLQPLSFLFLTNTLGVILSLKSIVCVYLREICFFISWNVLLNNLTFEVTYFEISFWFPNWIKTIVLYGSWVR